MMPGTVPPPLDVAWPATPDTVPVARHAVLSYLEDAATPNPPLKDVGLVVSEAVTNAVNHAYLDEPQPGEVRVRVVLHDEEVQVTVEDDGKGMTPRPDSPGLGLGLPLIASVSDRFDTRTQPDGGTCLSVWFRRAGGGVLAG